MIAAAGPTPLWYAARSTGYVSLLMLTAIVVLGIVTTMRWANRDWPRFMSQAVHRNLSLMVLVFLAIHILASTIDPFAGISVLNSVVPFTGSYRPVWLGLGVVSLELLVALTVTSVLRQRISFTVWKVVHWAAYACWPLALLHTLGTGSDVRSWWAIIVSLACVGVVLMAIAWRLFGAVAAVRMPVRLVGLVVTAAATIALLGFAVAGPLHSGWAKAAGTPDRLLAITATDNPSGGTVSPTPAPAAALPPGLHDTVSGSVAQGANDLTVQLSDSRDANLHITISVAGQAASGQLTITEGGATVCSATAAVAQDVQASCGNTAVDISLSQQADGTVAGQLVTQAVAP
ncbi:MAG TPA: ferric reductase-like transmembrane domain-containing protein [Candidatus Dormibacteraeota bacterium]|nr:ferric reductase-like transmembrane domain-containing protein [Candidatus Dormibacteraeota bacterium]